MTSLRRMIGRFLAAAGGAVMATLLSAAGWTAHAQASALNCEIDADDPMVLVCSGIVEEPLFIGPDYFEDVQEINFPKVGIWLETDDSVVALHIEPDAPGKTFTHTGDFGEGPGVDARSGDEATALRISGAGSLSLIVDGARADSLQGRVGVRLTPAPMKTLMGMDARPWLQLGWAQEFGSPSRTVTARLQGLPGHAMTIGGVETPAGRVRLGAGVTFAWGHDDAKAIHVQYTGEFAAGVKEHGLTVQASIRF